jgi:hypothetical protein
MNNYFPVQRPVTTSPLFGMAIL